MPKVRTLKTQIGRLPPAQLLTVLLVILTRLQLLSPKERKRLLSPRVRRSLAITERQLGVRLKGARMKRSGKAPRKSQARKAKGAKAPRRAKGSRKGKRRMSAGQKAGLRKAIHANPIMSPAAKRKALAKLS